MTRSELEALARTAAGAHGLEGALVCALVEQESGWQPWAVRFEPGYNYLWDVELQQPWAARVAGRERFPAPGGVSGETERTAQKTSWGLLQVMGAVARERGFEGPFLSELCEPAAGLEFGCRHLAWIWKRLGTQGAETVLLRWNGGGRPAYAGEVLARKGKYQR